MMAYHEILAAFRGEQVQNPHAQLWGERLSGNPEQEISGSVPVTFLGFGETLTDYRIYGNADGCGEYDSEQNSCKIPVNVNGKNLYTPVYIGSEPLYADEYISFSEQKIYRKISGTLTPAEPPVPLPALPTLSGTTILSAETEIQPSMIYLKGKIKSLATHTLTDSSGNILISSDNYQLVTKEQ